MKYRHVVIRQFGGPEVLQVVEDDLAAPGSGQALVKILAADVGFSDVNIRRGRYPRGPRPPFTPGYAMVGVVDQLGPGTAGLETGQRVAALTFYGSYSQYIVLPAQELFPVPEEVDPAEAVTVTFNYVAAYQMLHRVAHAERGWRILIHGAGGGLGTAFLELGHLAGLEGERCAALSGADTDFVMIITMAYTGMRWSEALGLLPGCLQGEQLRIDWKLYELESRFYRGRPKDGSIRSVDMPPFLGALIDCLLATYPPRMCTCTSAEPPWCPGERYVFLGPRAGHFRRSNYSSRIVRPAADGWYPKRAGRAGRPAMPVLADMTGPLPGRPLPPWPSAAPGEDFQPPQGRGVRRLPSDGEHGRCTVCGRSSLLRLDGTLVRHKIDGAACTGSGHRPSEQAVASWRAVRPGLTPHGLRHSHRTWLDDLGVQETLKSERMGHEIPGMAGVYGHIMPQWRQRLRVQLQELWEASLRGRARLDERSAVRVLEGLLAPYRASQ
jgi:integrase